jgi:endonuclease/exonuclease/phosphatase family metal-dependent hydrolase
VIIAGDLNVIRQSPELGSMLGALDAAAPESFAGHPFSFDPATNGIAGERYPGSDREHLDYVLLRNGHAGPAGWVNQTIFAKAPAWSMTRLFRTYTYTDFSDHYPVAGFSAGS